uniref:Uncharacterized protein n=1 Tax=Cyanistes caeruleus TaxID=156563 RepID=A0A8C0U2F3_CYACU
MGSSVLPCAAADLHFLAGTTGQITVTQDDGQVMVKQGHPFQTTCKYQSSVSAALSWYELRQGQAPQLLSYQAGSGPKHSVKKNIPCASLGTSSPCTLQPCFSWSHTASAEPRAGCVFLPWALLQQPRLQGHA